MADQFPFELRDRSQDVHQKFAGWIGLVGVEALRSRDEANPEARQLLNPGDAMHERRRASAINRSSPGRETLAPLNWSW